ncbi:MAG: DNA translocase FtsK [Candidatus Eisenbacteria bacterium]|nr:DNA translocase FtsK [Candidatus Eisenbacteria bacterium]
MKTRAVERKARAIEEREAQKQARAEARQLAADARAAERGDKAQRKLDEKARLEEEARQRAERIALREEELLAALPDTKPDKRREQAEPKPKPRPKPLSKSPSGYVLPPIGLLEEDTSPPISIDKEEVLENGRTLVRALKDFGIEGQLGQMHPGPVITQYEFEPAAGVKISQIVSRAEDLALALRASRVRMVAPIPGKAAVGIEVPNRTAARINFRTLLSELDLHALPGELPLVLGRDIRGRAHAARLDAMPHLLVAGTTGSGKSVCLNVLLLTLLYRRTPDELRLMLIDPKMLELTPYDGIPHLLYPVVTEPKMAARMLTWLVGEMERRYRRMAAYGVRNIDGYRTKMATAKAEDGMDPMPYIVVIVDELADLMMTIGNEVEGPIARLAQMARAVGIHLILATQRPSVDVLTGVIKANFPARIAFQVASKVDSRTILDGNGAESLLGKGDMLFLPPGKAEATRVHGAFVSDRDTEKVVEFWKQQPPAPEIFREELLSPDGEDAGFDDDLFEDALRIVVTQRMASTSFLQRRLKVGYSRAGRLMDLLESAGAVGAQDGSKAREVLADERFLEEFLKKEKLRATGAER